MAFLKWAIGGAVVVFLRSAVKKRKEAITSRQDMETEEEKRERIKEEGKAELEMSRRNSRCHFTDGVTEEEFQRIVYRTAKKMGRIIRVNINGMRVDCEVVSQSGLSSWKFSADFSDWGHITDKYWLDSDNELSLIPEHFAKRVILEVNAQYVQNGGR